MSDKIVDISSIDTPLEKTDVVLSNVFDTAPINPPKQDVIDGSDVVIPPSGEDSGQLDADHQFARNNMYTLLNQGQSAFQYAVEVAKSSESPRAFEVVGTMMKNLADMNSQLLELHQKKASVKRPESKQSEPTKVVNNSIVFQGSTAELNKMLNNIRKEQ